MISIYMTYAVGARGRLRRPREILFLASLGQVRGRDWLKRTDLGGTASKPPAWRVFA
jgi:hypothetical protein